MTLVAGDVAVVAAAVAAAVVAAVVAVAVAADGKRLRLRQRRPLRPIEMAWKGQRMKEM